MKQDPSKKNQYRRRYFILHHRHVFYYQMSGTYASIDLRGADVHSVNSSEPTLRYGRSFVSACGHCYR